MDNLIERMQRLPKRPFTFQGGLIPWPGLEPPEGAHVFPLWIDLGSGLIHTDEMHRPSEDLFRASLETLCRFVEKLIDSDLLGTSRGGACQQRIEVSDPALADYLRLHLETTGIKVELKDRLPQLNKVLAEMSETLAGEFEGPASLLDSRGVTIERVRAFAVAAARFFEAAPWRFLSDIDVIEIKTPKPPRGMTCFVVLGAGRRMYGLGLYPNRAAHSRFFQCGEKGDYEAAISTQSAQVTFDPIEDLPAADASLWIQHQLPVADERAFPLVMKHLGKGDIARPTKKELAFLEAVLLAMATTSEREIDSGHWCKEVTTSDGPVTVTLAIPDLLEPPSPQEWLRRGFAPDPRAHERLFADMQRFMEAHPPSSEDGLAEINRRFAGRSLDNPVTEPSTPAEHAQDLCFKAFDTYGRRRVQLAHRALAIDPDCADAYVILSEQAGTLDEEIAHGIRGVQAAEKALGANYFVENAGHFWGISATRPYMRARFGLAQALTVAGRTDEAILHYQELLRLNPNDNQGVRYVVLPMLMAAGRDVEAARLLKAYDEDTANWTYSRALLSFRLGGHSTAADRELRTALHANLHVPEVLLSEGDLPQPSRYVLGSLEEAYVVVDELRSAFDATPGALDWVANTWRRREAELDKLRREKRRKERDKKKKRKGR